MKDSDVAVPAKKRNYSLIPLKDEICERVTIKDVLVRCSQRGALRGHVYYKSTSSDGNVLEKNARVEFFDGQKTRKASVPRILFSRYHRLDVCDMPMLYKCCDDRYCVSPFHFTIIKRDAMKYMKDRRFCTPDGIPPGLILPELDPKPHFVDIYHIKREQPVYCESLSPSPLAPFSPSLSPSSPISPSPVPMSPLSPGYESEPDITVIQKLSDELPVMVKRPREEICPETIVLECVEQPSQKKKRYIPYSCTSTEALLDMPQLIREKAY